MKLLIINQDSLKLKNLAVFLKNKCNDILISNHLIQGYQIALNKIPDLIIVTVNSKEDITNLSDFCDLNTKIIINNITSEKLNFKNNESILIIENNTLQEEEFHQTVEHYINKNLNYKVSSKNILIIEDNKLNQIYYSEIVSKNKFNFGICEGIKDSINEINKLKFDLIVTDFKLKDGNAIQLLNEIRLSINHKTPVIIVSGFTKTELVNDYGNFECDCFLEKPIDEKKIKTAILKYTGIEAPDLINESKKTNDYDYSKIFDILKNDPSKIEISLKEFISILDNGITIIKQAMLDNNFTELKSLFHEILNLGKYYDTTLLLNLILEFKVVKSLELKRTLLNQIYSEIQSVNQFYTNLLKEKFKNS